MARWNDLPHREAVLNAAFEWRKTCFFGDGSIFTHDRIWTELNIAELNSYFSELQFGSGRSFFEKLDDQLERASPTAVQLASEIVWLIYLFPLGLPLPDIKVSVRIKTKRNNVLRYIEMAAASHGHQNLWNVRADNHPLLSDDVLGGLGRSGQAYNQKRPEMFNYFLRVLSSWKALRPAEREAFDRPDAAWDFAKWLDRIPSAGGVPLRHALLHLLYPEHFERIVSSRQKRDIASSFSRVILSRNGGSRLLDQPYSGLLQTDYTLYQIRQYLQEELGTNELDFYLSPLVEQWQQQLGPRPPLFDDMPPQPEPEPDQQEAELPEPEPEDVEVIVQGVAATGAVGQVNVHASPQERMNDPAYHHADMLRQIEDLEIVVDELQQRQDQPTPMMGHNNPPAEDLLNMVSREEFNELRSAFDDLKAQSERPVDNGEQAVAAAATVDRLGKRILDWCAQKADLFVDYTMKGAGYAFGAMLVGLVGTVSFWLASALGIPMQF